MSYFVGKRGIEYGLNAEEIDKIRNEWNHIFGTDISKKMQYVLEFLFEQEIICKSVLDINDDENDSEQLLSDQSRLYISPRGDEIFRDLLEYIDFLCGQEGRLRSIVGIFNTENEYENAFGSTPVTYRLLLGVKNSMEYSGYIKDNSLSERYHSLSEKINALM